MTNEEGEKLRLNHEEVNIEEIAEKRLAIQKLAVELDELLKTAMEKTGGFLLYKSDEIKSMFYESDLDIIKQKYFIPIANGLLYIGVFYKGQFISPIECQK